MQTGYQTDLTHNAKALKSKLKLKKLDRAIYGSDVKFEAALPPLSSNKISVGVGDDTTHNSNTQSTQTINNTLTPIDTILPSDSVSNQASPVGVSLNNLTPLASDISYYAIPNSLSAPGRIPVHTSSVSSSYSVPSGVFSTVNRLANTVASSLADELVASIHQGTKPSDIKKTKQKTTIRPMSAPPSIISTNPVINEINPVAQPIQAVSPPLSLHTSEISHSTASQSIPTGTSQSAIATATSSEDIRATDAINHQTQLSEVPTPSDEKGMRGKNLTYSNEWLQKHAQRLMEKYNDMREQEGIGNKKVYQMNITLYTRDRRNADPVRLSITKSNNKYAFRPHDKGGKQTTIYDQKNYDLNYSIYQAINAINDGRANIDKRRGEMTGLGLEEKHSLHWAHRRSLKDYNFVLYPAFVQGNVRYYKDPKSVAAVSFANASKHFLNIVRDIVDSGTFKAEDYARLDKKESHAANIFIKASKPLIPTNVSFDTSTAGDIHDLRERYQVLVGELSAGNHGKLIKEEMIEILQKLRRLKAIYPAKVRDLIKGLNEL